jgi:hypothetical protein
MIRNRILLQLTRYFDNDAKYLPNNLNLQTLLLFKAIDALVRLAKKTGTGRHRIETQRP